MITPLANERGSATIENLFSMGTLIGLVAAMLLLGGLAVSKVWLRYAGNEAAICLASDSQRTECEQEFRDRTAMLERIGHMRNFQLLLTPSLASVEWHFQIHGYNNVSLDLDGAVHLKLPLEKPKQGFV